MTVVFFGALTNGPAPPKRPGPGNGRLSPECAPTLTQPLTARLFTLTEARAILDDPVRDKTYQATRLGRDVVAWLAYRELGGAPPTTLDQYERDLSKLCLMFPRKQLADVTDGDLSQVIRTWPVKSRRVRKAAIAAFYKWAIKTRRVEVNPMQFLPDIKRTPKPRINTFTPAEVEALLGLDLVDAALMAILFDAGLRKTEARTLRLRDANPDRDYVVVVGKGDEPRAVPMSDRLRVFLADLVILERLERDDYLWYDRPGGGNTIRRSKPIGPTSFGRWWDRCITTARVEYRKPHTTRHTFATEWRRRGLGLDDVKVLLGHKDIRTTDDYYMHGGLDDVAGRMKALWAETA